MASGSVVLGPAQWIRGPVSQSAWQPTALLFNGSGVVVVLAPSYVAEFPLPIANVHRVRVDDEWRNVPEPYSSLVS